MEDYEPIVRVTYNGQPIETDVIRQGDGYILRWQEPVFVANGDDIEWTVEVEGEG